MEDIEYSTYEESDKPVRPTREKDKRKSFMDNVEYPSNEESDQAVRPIRRQCEISINDFHSTLKKLVKKPNN